jgi:DNA topoisomerase IA
MRISPNSIYIEDINIMKINKKKKKKKKKDSYSTAILQKSCSLLLVEISLLHSIVE